MLILCNNNKKNFFFEMSVDASQFYKNLALQRQQLGTVFLQLLIPTGLVCLIGLVQFLVDKLAADNDPPSPDYYDPINLSATIPTNELGIPDIASLILGLPFFYFSTPSTLADAIGIATYNGSKTGLLGEVDQIRQREVNSSRVPYFPETYWPFFLKEDDPVSLNDHLIEVYQLWKVILNDDGLGPAPDVEDYPLIVNDTLNWIRNREYDKLLPYGAYLFNDYDRSNRRLDYTTMAATRYGGLTLTSSVPGGNLSFFQYLYPDIDRRGNMLNIMHNALINDLQDPEEEELVIQTFYQGFPQQVTYSFDIASIAGVFLYGFATSLLMPVFITNLVTDKQERVLLMMQMSGVRMSIYWFVAYVYFLLLYVLISLAIAVASLAFEMRLFTQTSWALMVILFTLWGHALIALCFLLSTFFSKARTASVVGYLLVIISVSVSNILNSTVFLTSQPPFWYMIYPPFVFYRAIFLLEDACVDFQCFQLSALFSNQELSSIFYFLLAETIVLFPLTWYLQMVLPNEFGVRRSPIFFLEPLFKTFKAQQKTREPSVSNASIDEPVRLQIPPEKQWPPQSFRTLSLDGVEDEDVTEEAQRIADGKVPLSAPLLVRNLRKEYAGRYGQPSKVAIHNLSLSIGQDECFGLLGANGAGKTTLISVLTGVFEPSSGTARLAGYELTTNLSDVQRSIGVCPQFDIFYPDLSTEQHLLFYARLKGCTASQETEVVKRALEQVGLVDHAKKAAKNLSGGMRRRLSMAIAIIGDPQIVFLDEPTTGLDPLTRRQIWEILKDLRQGRSMILTTHSMEEADYLCTRIGIMSRGRLKCLGSQERLKSKYGSGYMLTVFSQPDQIEQSTAFVKTILPDTELMESFANALHFRVAKDKLSISRVFRAFTLERPSAIQDWGLSMATLEDVFVKIVKEDEALAASTAAHTTS